MPATRALTDSLSHGTVPCRQSSSLLSRQFQTNKLNTVPAWHAGQQGDASAAAQACALLSG